MKEIIDTIGISEEKLAEYNTFFANFYQEYQPNGPKWMGIMPMQWPLDLIMYQELLVEVKPTVIIETGTLGGATPLFLNDIYILASAKGLHPGPFRVITMDIENKRNLETKFPDNIIFINGNSVDINIVRHVESMLNEDDRVIVLLDSQHEIKHTLAEMELYGKMVSVGSYMVVEDSWIDLRNGNRFGSLGAIEQYLREHDDFVIDYYYQRWVVSQHHKGWLRKV